MYFMRKFIRFLLQNDFFQGSILFTASNFFGGFLNYLFNSLSAKLLGPVGYGEVATLFAYLTILSVPILVIITDIIRRLGSIGKNNLIRVVSWEEWAKQKLSRWSYLIIIYFLTLFFLPNITNLSLVTSFGLLIIFLLTLLSSFYNGVFQGLHWFLFLSLILISGAAVKLLGPLLVFLGVDGLSTIIFSLILSGIATIWLSHKILQTKTKEFDLQRHKINKRILQLLFTKTFITTAFSLIALSMLNNIDLIYVKKYFSAKEAGVYGAWSLFGKIITYLFGSIFNIGLIFFSAQKYKKYHIKALVTIVIALCFAGFIMFILYSWFGELLIKLIFNYKYLAILPYLSKAAIFGFFYSFIFIVNNFFLAKDSSFSLIVFAGIPFYAFVLIIYGKTLQNIFAINVYFSLSLALIYMFFIFYYNIRIWKQKKPIIS